LHASTQRAALHLGEVKCAASFDESRFDQVHFPHPRVAAHLRASQIVCGGGSRGFKSGL
jgi:hypothetical protein